MNMRKFNVSFEGSSKNLNVTSAHLAEKKRAMKAQQRKADRRANKLYLQMEIDLDDVYITEDFSLREKNGYTHEPKRIFRDSLPEWLDDVVDYRKVVYTTNSGKPASSEWIGITENGDILRHTAWHNCWACDASITDKLDQAIMDILNDNPEVLERASQYRFKGNPIFLYWSCSGKLNFQNSAKKDNLWIGDYLIMNLAKYFKGEACRLLTRGKTLGEILHNFEEIVEESRKISRDKREQRHIQAIKDNIRFDIAFGSLDAAIDCFREYSNACAAGTEEYLEDNPVNVFELTTFLKQHTAEEATRAFFWNAEDKWKKYITYTLEYIQEVL